MKQLSEQIEKTDRKSSNPNFQPLLDRDANYNSKLQKADDYTYLELSWHSKFVSVFVTTDVDTEYHYASKSHVQSLVPLLQAKLQILQLNTFVH